ncbi:hypothetical protein [Thiolapillus sp.]|uniref:hypothetical protein n=1 Tax=Thiolapillus sp. TaxID=2017437 RepID=UPI003AF8B47D
MRATGKQCGLAATGDYQPSLRSSWLAAVERKLNLRPRKCLSYRAPIEVFCDGPHWQDATPGGVTVIG